MLQEIRILDLGVIEEAVIELGPGLTVVTGETGAGKTMVVTGLGLLLGARADAALVRSGAARARVEGFVELPAGHPALARVEEAGGLVDDGLVIARTVTNQGRSRAHVGGAAAPVGVLGELAEHLVAVHGQADQWRLRRTEEHRAVLDRFGGEPVAAALAAYREVHGRTERARAELDELTTATAERERELDLLTLGLDRLERLDPQPGEDHALRAEDERLSHVEELRAAAAHALRLLAGDDDTDDRMPPALTQVHEARTALEAVAGTDPALGALGTRLAEIGHLITDVGHDLTAHLADLEADPERLIWVQERRAALASLTRQYGTDVDAVLEWGRAAAARVALLGTADDRAVALRADLEELTAERERAASGLTTVREAAAADMGRRITAELAQLAMGSAAVVVQVRPAGRFGAEGADEVEILLAANPGSPPRTVTRAASGGELSRVMLAIEVATAGPVPDIPTFVFDEVDAGVGGRAALDVGARLAALARHAQVVVVTHLAQVAAHADRHLVVRKAADGQVTRSGVEAVEGEQRVAELARMLGGTDSGAALAHARDLLTRVRPPA